MNEAALMRVIIGLMLVVAAILAAAWLARRTGLVQAQNNNLLRRVASLPLGARHGITVIEVDDTWLVVGVSATQVTLLHTLPARPALPEATAKPAAAFSAKLSQALKRR